ncbi:MAG: RNA-binding domain-containing protein [Methanobacteriaceae archaeon]|nr:RNA-binding domain-containing protein [Methanobacteriaceae archaeon]
MIHNISYRVFLYQTEDKEKVKSSINFIFPDSLPTETTPEEEDNTIIVLSDKIEKKRDIRKIIEFLNNNLTLTDKETINNELKNRIDETGNLFLRFDKQESYNENLKLVKHGDAIHVKIKIAAYPANKKNQLKIAEQFFN